MSVLYTVDSRRLEDIADAIREKTISTDEYTLADMPDAIRSIETGGDTPLPLTITDNGGTYTTKQGYSPITVDVPTFKPCDTDNVVDGKWVCPDDWDDVETIPLPDVETEQILYLVYRTDFEVSYITWGITSGAYRYTKGHVVDGEFVATSEPINRNSGAYIQEFLTSDFETSGKNTIVFKIEPQTPTTKLTGTRSASWSVNGDAYNNDRQSMVIRYGQLYYATQIGGNGLGLECDNIRNCKSLNSLSNVYSNNINLKKHRHINWDTSKVTNIGGLFNYCRTLIDCDMDFSNWVTDKCTSINNMFGYCNRLTGVLNLSGWDTKNVTNIAGIFRECHNITKIVGIEDWYLSKCGTTDNAFYLCYSLYQNEKHCLDLSNWHLSEECITSHSKVAMFQYINNIRKLDIRNFNLSMTTSVSSLMNNNVGLEIIDMRNIIPPTSLCTSMANIFSNNKNLKEILYDGDGIFYNWDFSKTGSIQTMFQNDTSLKSIKWGTPLNGILPSNTAATTSASAMFAGTPLTEEIDMSGIDIKNYTGNQLTGWFSNGNLNLKEFYPPKGINNNFTYNASYSISKASLLRILDALAPQTSAKTLTLGANKARLTAEEMAIATEKGWTIA